MKDEYQRSLWIDRKIGPHDLVELPEVVLARRRPATRQMVVGRVDVDAGAAEPVDLPAAMVGQRIDRPAVEQRRQGLLADLQDSMATDLSQTNRRLAFSRQTRRQSEQILTPPRVRLLFGRRDEGCHVERRMAVPRR